MVEWAANSTHVMPKLKRRRQSYYPQLESEKESQSMFSASIISCVFGAIHYCKYYELSVYNLAGIMNGIFFGHLFVLLFHIFAASENLHFVRVKRRKSSMSNHLFLPYDTENDPSKPLDSISGMIGLRGSNAEKIVSSLSYLIIGNSWLAVGMNIMETDNYYLNILFILGNFGLWLVMTWQLEYTFRSDFLHFLGVAMVLVFSFVCLLFQQDFSTFSQSLTFFAAVNGVAFAMVKKLKVEERNIHIQSLALLSLESIVLFNSAVAASYYLYNLQH